MKEYFDDSAICFPPGEGAKEKGDDALQRGVGRDRWSDEAPWLPERR